MDRTDMLQLYWSYWSLTLSVFPLRPRCKVGYKAIPWEPYQHRLSTWPEMQHWVRQLGVHNIALVTGAISGIIALDIDNRKGGDESILGYDLPITPSTTTGNGRHILFKHPGIHLPNSVSILPGVDVRGDGGYIVAPGSIHPSGKPYAWEVSPFDEEFAPLPLWLLTLLQPLKIIKKRHDGIKNMSRYVEAALDRELGALRRSKEGARNTRLYTTARNLGWLIGGHDRSDLESWLIDIAHEIGLPAAESYRTIRSGFKFADTYPRRTPIRPRV